VIDVRVRRMSGALGFAGEGVQEGSDNASSYHQIISRRSS
jgi:hypothetical protein